MSSSPDVLILGGGVIGLTMAFHLAKERVRVEIVDKGDLGQEASWAGAGMIPPAGSPSRATNPYDELLARSSEMFYDLSLALAQRSGLDNGFRACGGIVFPGEDEQLRVATWKKQGIRFRLLEGEELHCLERCLHPRIRRGYFLPEYAQVRNPRHVQSLIAACESYGVAFRPGCPVHALELLRHSHHSRAVGNRTPRSG